MAFITKNISCLGKEITRNLSTRIYFCMNVITWNWIKIQLATIIITLNYTHILYFINIWFMIFVILLLCTSSTLLLHSSFVIYILIRVYFVWCRGIYFQNQLIEFMFSRAFEAPQYLVAEVLPVDRLFVLILDGICEFGYNLFHSIITWLTFFQSILA